jgi:hypothetical protein
VTRLKTPSERDTTAGHSVAAAGRAATSAAAEQSVMGEPRVRFGWRFRAIGVAFICYKISNA